MALRSLLLIIISIFSHNAVCMKRGGDSAEKSVEKSVEKSTKKPKTQIVSPLCDAIEAGNNAAFEKLLAQKGAVDKVNSKGLLPLLLAIDKGELPLVEKILACMISEDGPLQPFIRSKAFVLACARGHERIVRLFLKEYPAAVQESETRDFLAKFDSLKELVKSLPNEANPLRLALMSGSMATVDLLTQTDVPSLTALECAWLLDRGVKQYSSDSAQHDCDYRITSW